MGTDVPEEFGGQGLGAMAKIVVSEELRRSIVPFFLPPDSPNLDFMIACCTKEQHEKYLFPYAKGEKRSALAMTEPGAGSDAARSALEAVHIARSVGLKVGLFAPSRFGPFHKISWRSMLTGST